MSDAPTESPPPAPEAVTKEPVTAERDAEERKGEAESEKAEEPGGKVEPQTYSRTVVRSLAALCIVFFIGTVVMAVLAAQQHSQLQQSRDARAGVEQVASRLTSALLTYDYRDLDKTKQSVLALSTGKFRTDYDQNFSGLSALFTTTKGQSTATIKDVFVSGIEHDTATAIVVFDERTQGTGGQRLNPDLYVRLSLVKVRGAWRVDDVTNLNFPVQAPTQATPTTVPPK